MTSAVWLTISALAATAGGDEKPANIEGTWVATKLLSSTEKKTDEDVRLLMVTFVFKDGRFVYSSQGKRLMSGTYKIDTAEGNPRRST